MTGKDFKTFPIRCYNIPSKAITPDFVGVKEDYKVVDGAKGSKVVTATFGLDGRLTPTKPTIYSKDDAFVSLSSIFKSDNYRDEVSRLVRGRTGFYSVLEVTVMVCEFKVRLTPDVNTGKLTPAIENVKLYQPCGVRVHEGLLIAKIRRENSNPGLYNSLRKYVLEGILPFMGSREDFLTARLVDQHIDTQ